MWHVDNGLAVVRLETDTFELDQFDNPIDPEYTLRLDLASFEAAMQNYLDSLNQALGLLSTEDLDFIMTEDLQYIAV
jgi:hypothetical protein